MSLSEKHTMGYPIGLKGGVKKFVTLDLKNRHQMTIIDNIYVTDYYLFFVAGDCKNETFNQVVRGSRPRRPTTYY